MGGPTGRTLALLSLLQTHRHWRGRDLAERLGVTERTVRRDVDRLRQLGYPVDAEAGPEGGYRLAVGAHVPPLLVDDDEAIALVVGLRAAAVTAIDGIDEATVAVLAKLDQVLPDRLRRRIDALQRSVAVLSWSPVTATVPAASLTVLSQACRDREEVRFDYQRRDGEESRRLVEPYHLVSAGRRWYLVAWDVRRGEWRTFRVDRMVQPALAGARFSPRSLPAADPATFVADSIRSMTVEHRATVVVDAARVDVEALLRWVEASEDGDGRTRVVLRADTHEWLVAMIALLATAFDVDVVDAPPEVWAKLAASSSRLGAAARS